MQPTGGEGEGSEGEAAEPYVAQGEQRGGGTERKSERGKKEAEGNERNKGRKKELSPWARSR